MKDDLRYDPNDDDSDTSSADHSPPLHSFGERLDYTLAIIQQMVFAPTKAWRSIHFDHRDSALVYRDFMNIVATVPLIAPVIGSFLGGYFSFGVLLKYGTIAAIVYFAPRVALPFLMKFSEQLDLNFSKLQLTKLVAYSLSPFCASSLLLIVPGDNVVLVVSLLSSYGFYIYLAGVKEFSGASEAIRQKFAVKSLILFFGAILVTGLVLSLGIYSRY